MITTLDIRNAAFAGLRGIGVPLLVMTMLAMMILPLPPIALDALFSFNIALSLAIVLAVIYVGRPLELSVFPTILLAVTLLRLALNVASTRVVLLEGHTGSAAAGKVIEAFGDFVVGGNYAVGLVVFAILVIINFIVVTKGAGRISEVSARFTLDAMPGKQMAIDADLNAGILTQEEAGQRRQEVREEADFYGSMDGATKFVRGDAVAGILILFINIIGGIAIGMAQHGLPMSEAVRNYTLLTIGDGLVAQIPSLLLSTAVAIIVTRVSRTQNLGQQVVGQLFGQTNVLLITAGILTLLGIVPGMPNAAFLTLAAACGGGAFANMKRNKTAAPEVPKPEPTGTTVPAELSWDDIAPVDNIGLEVGYRLIPLVDRNNGSELLNRIKGVRKKLSQQIGFLVQPVHVRDNLELSPNTYRVLIMGVPVAEAEVHLDRELAINPGQVFGAVNGITTKDPAFGLDAIWIEPAQRDHAQTLGYTVVDASTVIATHLSQLLQQHANELLGHVEVQHLLDRVSQTAPKLVEDLVPKTLPMSVVVKVLQTLLLEKISLKNMRKIVETLAAHGGNSQDPDTLAGLVRVALGRSIVQQISGLQNELSVLTLDPELEQILQQSSQAGNGAGPGFEPGLVERVHKALQDGARRQEAAGETPVLLVAPTLRSWFSRLTRHSLPTLNVLAYNEVPDDKQIRMVATVGK